MKTFEVWETSKVAQPLLFFLNSEGFSLHPPPGDLRGLEDRNGLE